MSSTIDYTLLLLGCIVFAINVGTAAVIWYLAAKKEKRCSIITQAIVTKKFLTRSCLMEYRCNGTLITRKVYYNSSFSIYRVGHPVNICVNPENPREIIILDILGGKSIKFTACIFAGIGLLYVIITGVIMYIK